MDKAKTIEINTNNGWIYKGTPDTMREVLVIWMWKEHPDWPVECSLAIYNQSVNDWTYEIVTANKEEMTTSKWGFRKSVDRKVLCWIDIPRYLEEDGHAYGSPIDEQ